MALDTLPELIWLTTVVRTQNKHFLIAINGSKGCRNNCIMKPIWVGTVVQ